MLISTYFGARYLVSTQHMVAVLKKCVQQNSQDLKGSYSI